jgi:hypothetical protein
MLMSSLAMDAMYFHAALNALSEADKYTRHIDGAKKDTTLLQRKIDALSRSLDGKEDDKIIFRNYSKLEPLYIQMEGAEYRLGEAYGPMLQKLATLHILCAAAAEAHINIQGQARLHGREWTAFERLSVDAKWLFLPKLLSLAGFDPGKQPFQGFSSLLHIRNRLVHFHIHKELWRPPGVPDFLTGLGFSFEAAKQSLDAVKGMVAELAHQLHQDPPGWLTYDSQGSFFDITFEE